MIFESGQDEYYTLATRRIYTYVSVLKSIVQPNTPVSPVFRQQLSQKTGGTGVFTSFTSFQVP